MVRILTQFFPRCNAHTESYANGIKKKDRVRDPFASFMMQQQFVTGRPFLVDRFQIFV